MSATQKIVKATEDLRAKRITADEFRAVMAALRESMTDYDYNAAKLSAARHT